MYFHSCMKNARRITPVYVKFNGNILGFDVPPIIEDGSTLVPMRFLFEQMGADVEWDSENEDSNSNA